MKFTKNKIIGSLLLISALILTGCNLLRVDPGNDPLVVNAERTVQMAGASFDMINQIDNANRGFWRTNAPGFHNFAEWLRFPLVPKITTNSGVVKTNVLRRGLAMIDGLNEVKLSYKKAKVSSNDLVLATISLDAALKESQKFLADPNITAGREFLKVPLTLLTNSWSPTIPVR